MDNRGEVLPILSGITFDIGAIFFDAGIATYIPQNYIQVAFLASKILFLSKIECHFKVLKICDTFPRLSISILLRFNSI